jgi:hypothetical protein
LRSCFMTMARADVQDPEHSEVAETVEQTVIRTPETIRRHPARALAPTCRVRVHFQFDTRARVCFVCILSCEGPE